MIFILFLSPGSGKEIGVVNLKEIMEEETERGHSKEEKKRTIKKEVRKTKERRDNKPSKLTEPINLPKIRSPPPAGEESDTGMVRSMSLPSQSPSNSPW